MGLFDYIDILKRRFWFFIIILILLFAITSLFWIFAPKTDEALLSFSVKRLGEVSTDQYGGYYAIQADDLVAKNFKNWMTSPSVINNIFHQADIDIDGQTPAALAKTFNFKVNSAQNIELKIKRKNREELEKLVAAIKTVTEEKKQADLTAAKIPGQISRTVELNSEPLISTKKTDIKIILSASLFSSLILSLVVIFLMSYFAKTVENEQQIKAILKKDYDFVKISSLRLKKRVLEEKIRVIRNLLFASHKTPFSILVMSLDQVAFEKIGSILAELSASTCKTVLIDASMDDPKLNKIYKTKERGLAEIIMTNKIAENLHKVKTNLAFVPVGRPTKEIKNLMISEKIKNLIRFLKKTNDFIVFVAPSILTDSATYSILNQVDSLVLVIELSKTKQESLIDFKNLIKNLKVDIKLLMVG